MYAVSMMLSATLMIIVIEIVRRFVGNRLPRWSFCALWTMVCARLLIPFRLPWSSSFFSFADRICRHLTGGESVLFGAGSGTEGLSLFFNMQSDGSTAQFAAENGYIHYTLILKAVWILGAVAFAVYFAAVYAKNVYKFRESLPVNSAEAESMRKRMHVRRKVSVRESDYIASPLTYGLLRPVILLPAGASDIMETSELGHIFAHELVHIKRFDAVVKVAATAAVCIYWFNPFVWVMYILFNRDIELSCDAAAVRVLGESSKADYAMTLVRFAELKEMSVFSFNSFGKSVLSARVNAVMTGGKKGAVSLAAAFILCVVVFAVFATSSDIKVKNTISGGAVMPSGSDVLPAGDSYGIVYNDDAAGKGQVYAGNRFTAGNKRSDTAGIKDESGTAVEGDNGANTDINASGDNLYEFDTNVSYDNMVSYDPAAGKNDSENSGVSSGNNSSEISSSPENMS